MRDVLLDLRYSFRSLARTPGFALLAILTLALGIGANSAMREQVNAMDRTLPIVRLRTMDGVFADSVARQGFLAQLLVVFATLALALAAVGTYG